MIFFYVFNSKRTSTKAERRKIQKRIKKNLPIPVALQLSVSIHHRAMYPNDERAEGEEKCKTTAKTSKRKKERINFKIYILKNGTKKKRGAEDDNFYIKKC
jgi:hypothetical protein